MSLFMARVNIPSVEDYMEKIISTRFKQVLQK